MLDELCERDTTVVLVAHERPPGAPQDVVFIAGDPTDEGVIARSKPEQADRALIACDQDADTMIVAVTLHTLAPKIQSYALTDSPIGQLAWVAEKLLWAWPDPETPIDRDAVLTTVGLYWHTATATSSARAYWEAAHDGTWWRPPEPSSTPTAPAVRYPWPP